MVREVLTLNIGQCGVQMGQTILKQYCAEHGIDKEGKKTLKEEYSSFKSIFDENKSGEYTTRNLMIDLQPKMINNIKTSKYRKLFSNECLLSGKFDAENNFASGRYTLGKEMMDLVNDRIRKLVDKCDNIQGFMIDHSVGGGTGSGMASLILETLGTDYNKKIRV